MRSGGRVVEGARLESEYRSKAYRGFESNPLRHPYFRQFPTPLARKVCGAPGEGNCRRPWNDALLAAPFSSKPTTTLAAGAARPAHEFRDRKTAGTGNSES